MTSYVVLIKLSGVNKFDKNLSLTKINQLLLGLFPDLEFFATVKESNGGKDWLLLLFFSSDLSLPRCKLKILKLFRVYPLLVVDILESKSLVHTLNHMLDSVPLIFLREFLLEGKSKRVFATTQSFAK